MVQETVFGHGYEFDTIMYVWFCKGETWTQSETRQTRSQTETQTDKSPVVRLSWNVNGCVGIG